MLFLRPEREGEEVVALPGSAVSTVWDADQGPRMCCKEGATKKRRSKGRIKREGPKQEGKEGCQGVEDKRESSGKGVLGAEGTDDPSFHPLSGLLWERRSRGKDLCHRPDQKTRRTQTRDDVWTL